MAKPINRLSAAAEKLVEEQSSEGTETSIFNQLTIRSRDEVGALYVSLSQMEHDMNAYIRNLVNVLYIGTGDGRLYMAFLNKRLPEGIVMLVDGAKGAVKIKPISTFTAGFILILITLVVVLNLINSRAGRAIKACRDNRIAAESMGVNVTKYKMMAFVTAAVLAGMAGALYGLNSSTVVPTQFTFNQSINVLVFVVLGGLGNVLGSVISAALLTILPEVLRAFADYRMLAYAVVLILVMIFTNNPTIRSFVNRLIAPFKKKETTPGGDAQ